MTTFIKLANPAGGFHDTVNGIDDTVAAKWIKDGKAQLAEDPKKPIRPTPTTAPQPKAVRTAKGE